MKRIDRTSDPLCSRVYNNVCAVVDGSAKVASCAKSVVYDYWNASFMCDCDNLLKVWYIVLWVSNALDLLLSAIACYKRRTVRLT